jgi:putative peptide zinc metalloprotease protein
LILFAVEIGWFIVFPLVGGLKIWWTLRGEIVERRRAWLPTGILACVIAGLFVPWSDRIRIPAVLESTPHSRIYAPIAGRIVELMVKEGMQVGVRDRLVVLESPTLEKEFALTDKRIEVERLKGQRQFVDREELSKHQVTLETLRAHLSQLKGLLQQQQRLSLTAPIAGIVTDRTEALHVGQWINKELPLAYVIDPSGEELHALAPETDVGYLHTGQSARFIPQSSDRPSLEAQVAEIRDVDESSFMVPYLLSPYGGEVAVREDANHRLKPESSVYRVTLHLVGPRPRWNQAVRGTVLVKGPRISFAQRAWEQAARVFIRESGA